VSHGPIQPDGVAKPASPYSPVFVSGDLVYTAGQVGADAGGNVPEGVEAQTRQALDNLVSCLDAAGCSLRDVMKVNSYLANIGDFPTYNAVYREYFEEPYPARTTVGAVLADGLLVEIEAVARRSD
jgi:2-iminobutanoate/2-iminopropanoate deaminase